MWRNISSRKFGDVIIYGIGSAWNNALHTICDVPEMRDKLDSYGIPKGHIVWALIVIGYPQGPGKLLAKNASVVKWVK